MTQAPSTTFAPKRTPWFGGFFALLILVLIAYAAMLFMPTQIAAQQSAAVVSGVPAAQSPIVDGMDGLTRALHVPGGYVDSNYQY